ncbi:MAG TPA: septal ring lytic transglycosylase RlpA family protein [Solirubrobacteraceae bacterium]|jgi:hypothetical protein
MYVPASPPTSPAVPLLAPVSISLSASAPIAPAVDTALQIRRARLNVLAGEAASVAGALHPGLSGRLVALQALGRSGWRTLADTRTGSRGRFRLRYVPRHTLSELVRLRFAGDPYDLASHRRLGRLDVYRLAEASWYGGGGNLACGGSLTNATMGVANKTLPCGSLVTLRYDGRSVRVPVIDRGPYVAGREFDLTEATKRALGFGDTGEVWSTL